MIAHGPTLARLSIIDLALSNAFLHALLHLLVPCFIILADAGAVLSPWIVNQSLESIALLNTSESIAGHLVLLGLFAYNDAGSLCLVIVIALGTPLAPVKLSAVVGH